MPGFDVLILGGGPAGCALAARLSEDAACQVALVEAGPDYGPRTSGRWPAELLNATAIPATHDWRDRQGSLPWARVIGGSSSINACAITQAAPAEYDVWRQFGGENWTWEALAPCLARAYATLDARPIASNNASLWHLAVLDAARDAGFPLVDDLDKHTIGAALVASNSCGATRVNAAFAYLEPARPRPNLTLLADTLADRVLIRSGSATGAVVQGPDGVRQLEADRVVLAAGAYGSPAILLRSGIGPEEELRRHAIRIQHALSGVGAELVDHCRVGRGFRLREDALRELAVEPPDRRVVGQAIVKWQSSEATDGHTDGHLLAIVPPDRSHARITVGLIAPRSHGTVRLRSCDAGALPEVASRFLSDPEQTDLALVTEGLELARDLAHADPLRRLIAAELEPGPGDPLPEYARLAVASYYHPTGTCRIGTPEDPGAVVDQAAGVHGVNRLLVADASIIPVSPRAGTHLTTLAVAERVAELIRATRATATARSPAEDASIATR